MSHAGSGLLLPQGHSLVTQPSAPSMHCFSRGWEPEPDIIASALVLSHVRKRGSRLEPS